MEKYIFIPSTTIILTCILLYLYFLYIQWSDNYSQTAKFDTELKNTFKYKLTLPMYLSETWKPINFWFQYYLLK